jgi:hypothetical protein
LHELQELHEPLEPDGWQTRAFTKIPKEGDWIVEISRRHSEIFWNKGLFDSISTISTISTCAQSSTADKHEPRTRHGQQWCGPGLPGGSSNVTMGSPWKLMVVNGKNLSANKSDKHG